MDFLQFITFSPVAAQQLLVERFNETENLSVLGISLRAYDREQAMAKTVSITFRDLFSAPIVT